MDYFDGERGKDGDVSQVFEACQEYPKPEDRVVGKVYVKASGDPPESSGSGRNTGVGTVSVGMTADCDFVVSDALDNFDDQMDAAVDYIKNTLKQSYGTIVLRRGLYKQKRKFDGLYTNLVSLIGEGSPLIQRTFGGTDYSIAAPSTGIIENIAFGIDAAFTSITASLIYVGSNKVSMRGLSFSLIPGNNLTAIECVTNSAGFRSTIVDCSFLNAFKGVAIKSTHLSRIVMNYFESCATGVSCETSTTTSIPVKTITSQNIFRTCTAGVLAYKALVQGNIFEACATPITGCTRSMINNNTTSGTTGANSINANSAANGIIVHNNTDKPITSTGVTGCQIADNWTVIT